MVKLLLIEDEPIIAKDLAYLLQDLGYAVTGTCRRHQEALQSLQTQQPDLVLCDIHLEGDDWDGIRLAGEIRRLYNLPIIFLTAKTQTKDVVQGFESGGTDYVRKPFSMDELIARINNQLVLATNQSLTRGEEEIKLSRFLFYPQKLELHSSNQIIKLSNREAQVLHLLCEYVNRAIDRKTLLMEVWGDDSFFHSRNLDVYIRKLRSYFSSDAGVQIITLKGQGYQFVVETTGTNH